MWKFLFIFILLPFTLHAFWPIYWEFGGEKRFFGPLASYKHESDRTSLTIRPIFFSYDSNEGGVYNYFYPLGKSSKDKSYFVPFYISRGLSQSEEPTIDTPISSQTSDTSLLLLFHGVSSRGSYGGLFPFYGKLYDRFGKDEIGFLLWPLYSYTETDGATKTNLLWPFFTIYTGTEKGFKLWPLMGSRERQGIKKSSFFLWPVFYKEKDGINSDEPVDKFYAMPFYLSSQSKTREEYMFMFPLYWYSKNPNGEKRRILWPIFSFANREDATGYSIFPLISSEKKDSYSTFSILWPVLYNETKWSINDRQYMKKRVLLINRYVEDEDGLFFNVWPIFERQEEQGRTHLFMPSILPIRSSDFDKIIKPLFTLMEHRVEGNRSMSSFLYGLFTKEEDDDENWKARFAFIFELKKESGNLGFELLSGLLGFDNSRIKVLFIPFKRKHQDSEIIKPE